MITGGFPLSINTNLPGWESVSEELKLIELARNVPSDGTIVEIGGELGRSAGQFLFATKGTNVTVYTVDMYPTDHHVAGDLKKAQYDNIREALGSEITRFSQIKGVSWEQGAKWDKGAIDLLFIDGDHTYEGVKRDIEAWTCHVKPGGIVVFHDYASSPDSHYLHHEVKRAVDETMLTHKGYAFMGQVDSLIFFRKGELVTVKKSTIVDNGDTKELPAVKGKPGRKPKGAK